MRAVRQYAFGPADNLRYEEIEAPKPGPGQVRVAVRAAGVHLLDTAIRAGADTLPFPLPDLPTIPGQEVAGVVDMLGAGVDRCWLGRRVVTHLGLASGGYAELAVREVGAMHRVPEGVAEETAVAMIGTGRTAMGILDVAAFRADDVVLVMAAAGGIGNLLVQAARNIGATVVGCAGGPAKTDAVRRLGAVAVDYTAPDWTCDVVRALNGRTVTVVVDGVGGRLGREALGLLGICGRFILYGWSAGEPTEVSTADLRVRGLTASCAVGPRILQRPGGLRALEEQALGEVAAGRLAPIIQTFPLADAAVAHIALETRATTGKVVLRP